MKKITVILMMLLFFVGCTATHHPYANIGASKTVNIGGVNVGVGIHDIIQLGK